MFSLWLNLCGNNSVRTYEKSSLQKKKLFVFGFSQKLVEWAEGGSIGFFLAAENSQITRISEPGGIQQSFSVTRFQESPFSPSHPQSAAACASSNPQFASFPSTQSSSFLRHSSVSCGFVGCWQFSLLRVSFALSSQPTHQPTQQLRPGMTLTFSVYTLFV